MVVGGFFFIILCFAIVALITTLFSKNKTAKLVLGAISLFLIIGLVLFLGLLSAVFNPSEEGAEEYIGRFESGEQFMQLNEDKTWESDTSFDCSKGTWKFLSYPNYEELEFTGDCEETESFIEILDFTTDVLTFRINQNDTSEGSLIVLQKKKSEEKK
jgi:hypothetical protein